MFLTAHEIEQGMGIGEREKNWLTGWGDWGNLLA
jgi:hypothetical protein